MSGQDTAPAAEKGCMGQSYVVPSEAGTKSDSLIWVVRNETRPVGEAILLLPFRE